MCGRVACTLDKCGLQKATRQYSKNKDDPPWIQKFSWQNYHPSYNLAPTQISPVLANGTILSLEEKDVVLMPMRWNLIPSWYKGTLEKFSLTTNNCRYESILEKPMFKGPAMAGRRCIVLADGFYEWKQISSKNKQPYFIYFPQEKGSDVFLQTSETSDEDLYSGPRLLTMAGLFDIWNTPEKETMYSFSIVTMAASKTAAFVHSRMPAILNGEDEVSMWLDSQRVPAKEAIALLKPIEDLKMHPVSKLVNYSKNNSVDCLKPLKNEEKAVPKVTGLTAWLKRGNTSVEKEPKHFKSES